MDLPTSAAQQNCMVHVDGLVQNCSNSIALAMELLQFCAKPLILFLVQETLTSLLMYCTFLS